jgi:hypothetical protein
MMNHLLPLSPRPARARATIGADRQAAARRDPPFVRLADGRAGHGGLKNGGSLENARSFTIASATR